MRLTERFRRLTLWNKVGFIGSVASVLGIAITLAQWRMQSTAAVTSQAAPSSVLSVAKVTSQEDDDAEPSDKVTFRKSYAARIHPRLPQFRFDVEVFSVAGIAGYPRIERHKVRVRVKKDDDDEPFQILEPQEFVDTGLLEMHSRDDAFLVIEDLNFDGYADLRYLINHSACCLGYRCYTYDPYAGVFQHDEELTGVFDFYSGIELISERKEIVHYTHCPPRLALKNVFRFERTVFKHVAAFAIDTSTGEETPTHLEATCDKPYALDEE